jgi:hypothetical protein
MAMLAITATAFGFNRAKAIEWITNESATEYLTQDEKQFLFDGAGRPERFQTHIESMWALAWTTTVVDAMDFQRECDSAFVTMLPDLKQNQSSDDFRTKVKRRPLEQVVAACDLAYCLHWAIRQSQIGTGRLPRTLKPYLIVDRRHALEWALSAERWDEISLDT